MSAASNVRHRDTASAQLIRGPRLTAISWLLFTVAIMLALWAISPYSLLMFLSHGLPAAGILLAAVLLGMCVVPGRWVRAACGRAMRDEGNDERNGSSSGATEAIATTSPAEFSPALIWLTATAIGSGLLSVAVLAWGCCGILERSVWLGVLALASIAGATRALKACATPPYASRDARPVMHGREALTPSNGPSPSPWLTALIATPFLLLSLIAAAHAPGFLWEEEGFGYDALEYHLEMPREYLVAGRIAYAPHNVYANFPANVEMLYLLSMIVHGDAIEGGLTAQYIHMFLGLLTVAAATQLVSGRSSAARRWVFLLMLTTPWTLYLSGLAFVENGMMFYGMLALVWAMRFGACTESAGGAKSPAVGRTAPSCNAGLTASAMSGVLAGLSCGCKYTALPLIATPIALALMVQCRGMVAARLARVGVYVTAGLIVLTPWLVKNVAMTGSPVFPLANGMFKAFPPGWDEDSQARWDAGHAPAPEERAMTARLEVAARVIFADPYQRMSACLWLLAVGALLIGWRDRTVQVLGMMLMVQLAIWLLTTHLYARFAMVALIPLAGLAARALNPSQTSSGAHRLRFLWTFIAAAGVFANLIFCAHMAMREFTSLRQPGVAEWFLGGEVPGFEYIKALHDVPEHEGTLVIGDARSFYLPATAHCTVVFNQLPLGQAVRRAKTLQEVLDWLRGERYRYVLFHWGEIGRLRRSRYGFDPMVDETLARRLCAAGLQPVEQCRVRGSDRPYAELYLVPPNDR